MFESPETRNKIEPSIGVKGIQIVNLARDLARSLSLTSIRVVETIPGKNYMGLELPNPKRQIVRLTEILGSKVYNDSSSSLTIALGKTIHGEPYVTDDFGIEGADAELIAGFREHPQGARLLGG